MISLVFVPGFDLWMSEMPIRRWKEVRKKEYSANVKRQSKFKSIIWYSIISENRLCATFYGSPAWKFVSHYKAAKILF